MILSATISWRGAGGGGGVMGNLSAGCLLKMESGQMLVC